MVKRCESEHGQDHRAYHDRGIRVCDRWRHSFAAFRADMGDPPDGHSIERVNGSLGYSPDNCRWATSAEQSRNKRNNVWLEHNGIRMIVPDWAAAIGINPWTLRGRIKKWGVERALTAPVREWGPGRKKGQSHGISTLHMPTLGSPALLPR
jgi:hypothetical protein